MIQDYGHNHSSDSAISIQKWMNKLKLGFEDGQLDERVSFIAVEVFLPVGGASIRIEGAGGMKVALSMGVPGGAM